MLKIPKQIRKMPWPEPYENKNALLNVRVIVNTPVVDHERLLTLGKSIKDAANEEIYAALLSTVKEAAADKGRNGADGLL